MNKRYSTTQRTLSGLALMLSASVFHAPAAFAACECLCVDGAPYNVCTAGFAGQTQDTTSACTDALAVDCPVPDPVTTSTPSGATEPAAADPVNAAAAANGLDCKPRQVYRPDLGRHKVYKVCMPEKMAKHQEKRAKAEGKRAHKEASRVAARDENRGWKGNWKQKQANAYQRKTSWDWRDQEHWKNRHEHD